MKSKTYWRLLLIIATILLIYGVVTKEIYATIISLVIALIIQKYGNEILFEDFNRKQDEKIKKIKQNNNNQ